MTAEPQDWLIYGATGYTGRKIAECAVAHGLSPRLCARDGARLSELASRLDLRAVVARLDRPDQLEDAARGCKVVLNAAGPFKHTAPALIELCLARGIHYTDVSGEVDAIQFVAEAHARARSRATMLMPAIGFDVAASDCLALHTARRLHRPSSLRLGFAGLGVPSRGSARTIMQESHLPIRVRRGGALASVPPGSLEHRFDFGRGPRTAVAVSWGDCVTAYYSTGIDDIETYMEATPRMRFAVAFQPMSRLLWGQLADDTLAAGLNLMPSRVRAPVIVAEAENRAGEVARSRLVTPDVYDVTSASSVAVVERVLAGDVEPGFQTPARVYGSDFILDVPGVTRVDL